MNKEFTKFEEGAIYQMSFIGDSDLKPEYICIKRTAKTATFERFKKPGNPMTRRIKVYDNSEYVLKGSYSMAPSINSRRVVG